MISTRNRVGLLPKALESISNQDYGNKEVIIVDDASSDGTSEYVKRHHPEVRLYRFEKNLGLIVARNLMMREARGEFIISLDDDATLFNSDAITRFVKRISSEPDLGIVTFNLVSHSSEAARGARTDYYTNLFLGGAHGIRKAILNQTGYYSEFLFHQGEETDLAFRVLDRGFRIAFCHSCVVIHKGSPIARDFRRMHVYGARNHLLRAWINEPFPWWILSTGNAVIRSILYGAKTGTLPYVLDGFLDAIRKVAYVRRQRHPVRLETMHLFLSFRHRRIQDPQTIELLYRKPPGFIMCLTRELANSIYRRREKA